MTPRPLARMRRAAWLLAAVGLLTLAGCDPRSIFYFLQPFEPTIAPPGPITAAASRTPTRRTCRR